MIITRFSNQFWNFAWLLTTCICTAPYNSRTCDLKSSLSTSSFAFTFRLWCNVFWLRRWMISFQICTSIKIGLLITAANTFYWVVCITRPLLNLYRLNHWCRRLDSVHLAVFTFGFTFIQVFNITLYFLFMISMPVSMNMLNVIREIWLVDILFYLNILTVNIIVLLILYSNRRLH